MVPNKPLWPDRIAVLAILCGLLWTSTAWAEIPWGDVTGPPKKPDDTKSCLNTGSGAPCESWDSTKCHSSTTKPNPDWFKCQDDPAKAGTYIKLLKDGARLWGTCGKKKEKSCTTYELVLVGTTFSHYNVACARYGIYSDAECMVPVCQNWTWSTVNICVDAVEENWSIPQ